MCASFEQPINFCRHHSVTRVEQANFPCCESHDMSATTQKQPSTITVRLKQKQSPKKRPPRKKRLFSWKGLEEKRELLKQKAHDINRNMETLTALAKPNNWSVAGLVANGVRDPFLLPPAGTFPLLAAS